LGMALKVRERFLSVDDIVAMCGGCLLLGK
jgi:hypothetical protein